MLDSIEKLKRMKDMDQGQIALILDQHGPQIIKVIKDHIIAELTTLVSTLQKAYPCRQLQFTLMDLVSIDEHLTSLLVEGPKEPHNEVPLDASTVEMDPKTDLPSGWSAEQGVTKEDLEKFNSQLEMPLPKTQVHVID